MEVRSALALFDFGQPKSRPLYDIDTIVVHRISVAHVHGFDDTPLGIASFFETHPEGIAACGGSPPYHFLIDAKGIIHQALRLLEVANGAKGYNRRGIQVALIGNFTKQPPTPEQLRAAEQLCAALSLFHLDIIGHTEKPGTSADPTKDCPGRHLDLPKFRAMVKLRAAAISQQPPAVYGIAL